MQIGSYLGNDPNNVQRYESWLGRPLDNVLFYLNQSNWNAFDSSVGWATGLWKPVDRSVIWSVPLTVEGTSLASVANGEQNYHFQNAAQQLAATRPGDGAIIVRLGWEANGSWMPWAAEWHEADFKQAYQTVVNQFRSVSNRFQFDWDVNVGGGYDPAKAYPGDGFVDIVGADLYYNSQWDPSNPAAAFAQKVGQNHGLQWISDFANAHGKRLAVSEWGVHTGNAGDYIEAAAAWFQSHNVALANYWESDAAGYDGILENGSKPGTASAFLSAFGSSSRANGGGLTGGGLTLQVSEDAFWGDAQFRVFVDGAQVGDIQTAHASHAQGQTETLKLDGQFSSTPNEIRIEFINDLYHGNANTDRNLYVHSVSIGGHDVHGSLGSNSAGWNSADTAGMYSNGSLTFHPASGGWWG